MLDCKHQIYNPLFSDKLRIKVKLIIVHLQYCDFMYNLLMKGHNSLISIQYGFHWNPFI